MRNFFPWATGAMCVFLAVAGVGCGGSGKQDPGPVTDVTRAFLTQQNLPKQQEPHGQLLDRETGTYLFSTAFGPPQDCPSGCFYLGGFGVNRANKAGWIYLDGSPGGGDPTQAPGSYDFDSSDTYLFSDAFDQKLRHLEGFSYYYDYFQAALARDKDTPPATLLRIARRLQGDSTFAYQQLTDALLSNPSVQTNRDVLMVLTALPVVEPGHTLYGNDDYQQARQKAAEFLAGLTG